MKDKNFSEQEIKKKVFSFIEERKLIQEGDRVIAGISGGADSVCLFWMLLAYRSRCPFSFAVAHINHGVREEAAEDADFVKRLCGEHQVPFFLYEGNIREIARREKYSEEDAGRRLRYQSFEDAAAAFGANKIAVAHNENDRAETMLFHLFRGSGLRGLRGILPVRGNIIRPILCLERGEIEAYLTENGKEWCTDATNAEDDYARNRIRHHILPYAEEEIFPGAIRHMGRTADILAETEEYLEEQTAEALGEVLCSRKEAEWVFLADEMKKKHPVIQKRLLLKAAEALSPTGKDVEEVHIRALLGLSEQPGNREIQLPMGITGRREYEKVFLQREIQGAEEEILLPELNFSVFFMKNGEEVPRNQYTKWFDYDKMRESPVIRFRQTGDFLTITDGKGQMRHKSLKEYMVTEKIPRSLRDKIPVLAEGNHVIWLIGYRISEYYKINRNTKRVLQVQLKGNCKYGKTEEEYGGTHQSNVIRGRGRQTD